MWKDIKGFEDKYEISDSGEVRNKISGKILNGDINSAGYRRVILHNKDHIPPTQRYFIHRLVAQTFIPNPDNQPIVNHIDHNKLNNNVNNLEWTDYKGNSMADKYFWVQPYRPFIVLSDIDNDARIFETAPELAEKLNMSK